MEIKYVSLIRVSTVSQGESGLGLEAQLKAINEFIDGKGEVIREFVEVESGGAKNRKVLEEAIAFCKKHKATLVVARLDRLSRRVTLISQLLESGIEFVAVDNPHANKFTIHILAAVSEYEREAIKIRTKKALQAARDRGVKLGTYGKVLAKKNKENANAFAKRMKPIIDKVITAGAETHRAIADELNRMKVKPFRGDKWHRSSAGNLLKRIATI